MILFKLLKWKFIDLFREIKRIKNKLPKPVHLYNIYGYFGLPGKGKTMAMCQKFQDLRLKYGKDIYIMTNFNYLDQDFEFTTWRQLLEIYDKPLIVGWDEVQNEFNSRDFKNFPIELLTRLTQVRKGNGIQLHYTAQRWERVDKVFRELTTYAIQCTTNFSRLTSCKYYFWEDYIQLQQTPAVELKMRIKASKKIRFVQTDFLRNSYDSFKMLESAKSKQYIDRQQLVNIENFYQ